MRDSPNYRVVLDGELSLNLQMDGEPSNTIKVIEHDLPVYTGATEVTPSEDVQTLQTADMAVLQNIVVNPIPSNYGRITWNGSTLTVS